MRVAAFLYSYPPDRLAGADLMSQRLLEAVAAAGHEVTVYTTQPVEPRDQNGVHVMSRPRALPITAASVDLLYTHPDLGAYPYSLARSTGIPLVGVVHNTSASMHSVLGSRRGALQVFNSHSTKTALAGVGGIICRPPFVVGDHATEDVMLARKTTAPDRVTLVNLNMDKGVLLFWDLAARMPDTKFLGVMGAYGPQTVAHPQRGALPNVDIIGPTHPSEMGRRVWSRTRVLIAPSSAESWGMTAVEALCCGIPVVAHPTPGLRESLGDAGTWVDRNNASGWMQAINDVWCADSVPLRRRALDLEAEIQRDVQAFVHAVERLTQKS